MPLCFARKLSPQAAVTLFCLMAFSHPTFAGSAVRPPCQDPIPQDCREVRSLGEMEGCACFVCNPKTDRKKVCTRNQNDKRTLLKQSRR
jgi:hypothetical protein